MKDFVGTLRSEFLSVEEADKMLSVKVIKRRTETEGERETHDLILKLD